MVHLPGSMYFMADHLFDFYISCLHEWMLLYVPQEVTRNIRVSPRGLVCQGIMNIIEWECLTSGLEVTKLVTKYIRNLLLYFSDKSSMCVTMQYFDQGRWCSIYHHRAQNNFAWNVHLECSPHCSPTTKSAIMSFSLVSPSILTYMFSDE